MTVNFERAKHTMDFNMYICMYADSTIPFGL